VPMVLSPTNQQKSTVEMQITSSSDAVCQVKSSEPSSAGTSAALSEAPRREIEYLVEKVMMLHKKLKTEAIPFNSTLRNTALNQR
jgi:hypothetical protein